MTELDPRIHDMIARSRASHAPPPGVEQRMLAQFHAQLGGGPAGGEGMGGPGEGGVGISTGGQVLHAIKIVTAVVSLTAAGLGGVWAVGEAARSIDAGHHARDDPSARVDPSAQVEASARDEAAATPLAEATPDTDDDNLPEPEHPSATPERAVPEGAEARLEVDPPGANPTMLAAELKLIQAARQATPGEALTLLERHAEQFGDGALSNERESLRVVALCELDRRDDAQRASERFVARNPGPLLTERVRAACATKISLPTTDPDAAGNGSP